jgi:hypothetical protein
MKELHDERLDIPVLSVCSVVCDVQMIEVIRKESMVTALDPMRLDFILTWPHQTPIHGIGVRFGNVAFAHCPTNNGLPCHEAHELHTRNQSPDNLL